MAYSNRTSTSRITQINYKETCKHKNECFYKYIMLAYFPKVLAIIFIHIHDYSIKIIIYDHKIYTCVFILIVILQYTQYRQQNTNSPIPNVQGNCVWKIAIISSMCMSCDLRALSNIY